MHAELVRELFRLAALLLLSLLLGLILGYPLLLVSVGLSVFIVHQFLSLSRLLNWLVHDRRGVPPEAPGVWGEVFYHLYRQYRRNRKRKQRIARLIRAFRDSTSAMPDGTVVVNRNWQIVWMNDAAEKLLGLNAALDVGQRIGNLVRHPDFIRYLTDAKFGEPLETFSPVNADRRLSFQVTPYGDEGQRLLLVRDITRLFRLEQMRREFVANASHELRSPLTVIRGYLEALQDDPALAKEWQVPLDEMRRQSERMSGIIEDLLELSRLETGSEQAKGEEIDVPGLISRIREEALALGEGPEDIELDLQTRVHLRGIEKEIYSAFSNLVFNACRYTPKSGRVTIRWHARDNDVCLTVTDTGIGIAREHIPRLTERFYRVDQSRVRAKGGTGLGLAIVKHVLQRHGARLEIESEPGKGSSFTCVFPASRVVLAAA
ncbi:MAG: phosphate regulon sensor histidine kinase PhoR [Gammaproteobacteria bacterium]|nr:phosphate regulon sensor histidine kinase PhoR [Gammaproteobacteria bacterium]